MIVLSCSNLSKSFVVDNILEDISFSVTNRDKIGIIGNNGSGKTTLLNILSGKESASSGEVYGRKDFKIGYLEQHTSIESDESLFNECLKVFGNLIDMEKKIRQLEIDIALEGEKPESHKLQGLMDSYSSLLEEFNNKNGYAIESNIKGTLKGLGFEDHEIHKSINTLSGGQKSRLALAKLLLEKPDILLLDEPTNHLDIDAINWLENYLNEYDGAALIISHDRYFLDNVVNKIFLIENTGLKIYNSNYSNFMKQRKKDIELLKKQYSDQQKELKRQKEIIERFSNYGGSRYIKQAQARQKMLDKIELIDLPSESQKTTMKFEPKIKSGRDVLMIEDLSKSFDGEALFENVSFNIYRGERVGLIGANGVGKTSLFKMIMGKIPYDSGKLVRGHHVEIGYFDQEQTDLTDGKTVVDEIWDDHPKFTHYDLRSVLSKFLFIGDDIFKETQDLSGGERGRLALLKMMLSDANFLLMDEPTNHLDIDSKEILEDALLDYEASLLVISHDRYFLNRVCDRIIELNPNGSEEFLGNYNYYLEKKKEGQVQEEEVQDQRTKTQIKLERKKERERQKEEKALKKELEKLEKDIFALEELIEELDQKLCDETIYEDSEKLMEVTRKREDSQTNLDKLYDQWLEFTES